MKRISRIEEAPTIFNQAVNPLDIHHFVKRVHSTLEENDPRYPYYLTWVSESVSKSARSNIGPDPIESVNQLLEQTTILGEESDEEFIEEIEEEIGLERYRLSLVYILSNIFVELGEVGNAVEVLDEYRDEFQKHPLYGVLRGEIMVQQGNQEAIDDALESVWRVREDHKDWAEVQKGTARVIVEALERDLQYNGYNSDIFNTALLEKAKVSIDEALAEAHDHPEYLFVEGRVQTLDGRFGAARKTIRRAIEHLSPKRPAYDRVLTRYRIELSNVDIQEQEHTLKSETEQAVEQLDKLREDYQNASQQFQTRTLQFLGFFTGLIGIVVVSAQVAISVDSTTAAAQLILILIGSLLFSCGGFGFLLPQNEANAIHLRIFGVLISGAILICAGIWL